MGITTATTLNTDVVIQERKTSNEFIIREITENFADRFVRATVELGPFTETPSPIGTTKVGVSRRMIIVWEGQGYDSIRDTWTNQDLIQMVNARLSIPNQ